MKIRYYHRIDGWRWLGFILAMRGAFILSGGDPSVQWLGLKDKDLTRALMELMYLLLAVRGIYNWLIV